MKFPRILKLYRKGRDPVAFIVHDVKRDTITCHLGLKYFSCPRLGQIFNGPTSLNDETVVVARLVLLFDKRVEYA